MKNTTSKRRCFARIEYRAVQQEIEARLEQGYSLSIIYDELCKAGRLTMAYTTFCDYVRGGGVRVHGKKKEAPRPDASELLSEIMESIERRTDSGIDLKSIYHKLTEWRIIELSYSGFCNYFRKAGAYLGKEISDNFVFFEDYGLITFYYRLASLFEAESDSADGDFCTGTDSVCDNFIGMED